MPRNELVIRIALPSWSRRRWLSLVTLLVILCGAAAYALDLTWIDKGKPLSSKKLNENLAEIYALLSGQADCPPDYARDPSVPNFIVCKSDNGKGNDEMVKVGKGRSSFWIDRYEASIWSDPAGTMGKMAGVPWGIGGDDYPSTFPKHGQRGPSFRELYAVSRAGVLPSVGVTWFQAQQACRAAGKRLPSDEEWLAAASGINDPGANNGTGGACLTNGGGAIRQTAMGAACVSAWGAQDMIGNLNEITSQWYAGVGNDMGFVNNDRGQTNWPAGYGNDATWNIRSWVGTPGTMGVSGLPAMSVRGGGTNDNDQAGVFAMALDGAPSSYGLWIGFRCVSP